MENTENHQQFGALTSSEEQLYDLSMLEEMEDDEYVLEMLNILLLEASIDLKEMRKAMQAGKIDTVCQTAHKLKSSAGIIQATKLTDMLTEIETMGKKGVAGKELTYLVEGAAHQYLRIERALKIYVEQLK